MHREQLVEARCADEVLIGPRQLHAHGERKNAAQRQEDQGGDDVAAADFLVVDGRQPAEDPRRTTPRRVETSGELGALELGPVANQLLALFGELAVFLLDFAAFGLVPGGMAPALEGIGAADRVGHLRVSR